MRSEIARLERKRYENQIHTLTLSNTLLLRSMLRYLQKLDRDLQRECMPGQGPNPNLDPIIAALGELGNVDDASRIQQDEQEQKLILEQIQQLQMQDEIDQQQEKELRIKLKANPAVEEIEVKIANPEEQKDAVINADPSAAAAAGIHVNTVVAIPRDVSQLSHVNQSSQSNHANDSNQVLHLLLEHILRNMNGMIYQPQPQSAPQQIVMPTPPPEQSIVIYNNRSDRSDRARRTPRAHMAAPEPPPRRTCCRRSLRYIQCLVALVCIAIAVVVIYYYLIR